MQYLSKAYSYYSGINPATLSGAIDVIVVRHVDDQGNVTLSSSPFHVRFGKLQVIRAGEKRVTIRLPNNLAPPHVAPFSMKVGETGEAFFVVETDEQVPEELLTSPVVMPTQTELPPSPPPSSSAEVDTSIPITGPSLTQEPFGETEKQVIRDEPLDEVDFLDLNAPSGFDEKPVGIKYSSSSSLRDSTSSLLPSIPHVSSSANVEHRGEKKSETPPEATPASRPPNPMTAKTGEPSELPEHDSKLSDVSAHEEANSPDDLLPRVEPGEGEGPGVLYGKDVVLDMAGYHSANDAKCRPESPSDGLVESFIQDLLASTLPHRPQMPFSRATDPDISSSVNDDPDVSLTSTPVPELASEPDLPATLASMSLSPASIARRFNRGQSEPPQDLSAEWNEPRRRSIELDDTPKPGKLRNVEDSPFMFILDTSHQSHVFELALSENTDEVEFARNRVTFQTFIENPAVVDDPRLIVHYSDSYYTWASDYRLLYALAMYRRNLLPPGHAPPTLPSLTDGGADGGPSARPSSGSGWSRWWRRGQTIDESASRDKESTVPSSADRPLPLAPSGSKQYAKTLRLSSDQLKQLNLKLGPNTVQFSVTSSYSGMAICTSRIFLWEESDQIVISDIDGTITKSDALGHVFAAIGRDWTHLGIARLYTDICNNGYKILYLTSRAIGQADTTREYLKSIAQGDYRLPEGPVIMSPDRLMASLHREVIMRKPEVFKMACLRDIQRLFGNQAREAFFAGFGNRITDAMSYRSVGIEAAKIYTIDSTGVVKTELLQAAGHKGSYIQLNDLVNEVFPPVSTKFKPEFTDFNYWRDSIPDIPLPDFTPPSPALSARSDTSGRLSVLGKITGLARRPSRQPILPTTNPSTDPISRPSSPLMAPSITSDELSDAEDDDARSLTSMPGEFEEDQAGVDLQTGNNESFDDDALFDDDILAAGEMQHVPF